MKNVEITNATYIGDYKIEVCFTDGKTNVVDFAEFLSKAKNPMTTKYRNKDFFSHFTAKRTSISWGKDNEMLISMKMLRS